MQAWLQKCLVALALLGPWLPTTSADFDKREDAGADGPGLRDATVLIVRHAEKPRFGRGLSARGKQRAQAYASYFDPLRLGGIALRPQRLIAATNSWASKRSLLTLKPLSAKLNVPIEQDYTKDQFAELARSLRQRNAAPVVLIVWHHGHLDKLIDAFGARSDKLHRYWPSDVYNWLVILRFDARGRLDETHSEVVKEHVMPEDKGMDLEPWTKTAQAG